MPARDKECNEQPHSEDVNCVAVQRLLHAHQMLSESHSLSSASCRRARFIEFCDTTYPMALMLEDHTHFVRAHSSDKSLRYIASAANCLCASLSQCTSTARHYRMPNVHAQEEYSLAVALVDSLHVSLFHLQQV